MLELFSKSTELRNLIYGAEFIAAMYALAAIIRALR